MFVINKVNIARLVQVVAKEVEPAFAGNMFWKKASKINACEGTQFCKEPSDRFRLTNLPRFQRQFVVSEISFSIARPFVFLPFHFGPGYLLKVKMYK